MLEHYATKHSHLVVQKKKKNKKRKNKGKNKWLFLDVLMKFAEYSSTSLHAMNILFPFCWFCSSPPIPVRTPSIPTGPQFSQVELDDKWDDVSGDLSSIFQGRGEIPQDATPFDALSQIDEDQQR